MPSVFSLALFFVSWSGVAFSQEEPNFFEKNVSSIQVVTHFLKLDKDTVKNVKSEKTKDGEYLLTFTVDEEAVRNLNSVLENQQNPRVMVTLFGEVIFNGMRASGTSGNEFLIGPVGQNLKNKAIDQFGHD